MFISFFLFSYLKGTNALIGLTGCIILTHFWTMLPFYTLCTAWKVLSVFGVFLVRIQCECRKYGPEKLQIRTLHAVLKTPENLNTCQKWVTTCVELTKARNTLLLLNLLTAKFHYIISF